MSPILQEVFLEVKEKFKDMKDEEEDGEVTVIKAELKRFKNELTKVDKFHRERILTLTVAAENGLQGKRIHRDL